MLNSTDELNDVPYLTIVELLPRLCSQNSIILTSIKVWKIISVSRHEHWHLRSFVRKKIVFTARKLDRILKKFIFNCEG